MFDIGSSELVVIAVVALVVLGPTRLPGLVRKVGRWVGKARSMARDFREQLESEVNVEELNKAAKKHLHLDDDSNKPFEPPQPAEAVATSATSATPWASSDTEATAPGETATDTAPTGTAIAGALADPPAPDLTYPYGTPTDTSSMVSSADPYARNHPPRPGDDAYSHAHDYGATPEAWNPEADPEPGSVSQNAPMQAELALSGASPATETDHDRPDKQAT